jgi:peptidoglycan/xylan/chitin deacetylase (PgdA/CDA1 family)
MDHPERRGMAHRKRHATDRAIAADGTAAASGRTELELARVRHAGRLLVAVQGSHGAQHTDHARDQWQRFQFVSRVAAAARDAGFEFMGHGFIQGPTHKLDNQGDAIRRTVDAIAAFTGSQPRSWESPGLAETNETLDLLRANGIEYVADWVIDDLPQEIETPYGIITTIPYTVETNDIVILALQHLPAEQFARRCIDQFDRLYLEGDENARVMALSIHPYITGVPHRARYLEEVLDYIVGHDGVALMTASQIGDWYRDEMRLK